MTHTSLPYLILWNNFNSHPHEEDDRTGNILIITQLYFNSHPHEEDDSEVLIDVQKEYISTHILTKRMTPFGDCGKC